MPQRDSDAFTYSDGNLATVSSGKWTKLSGFADLTVVSNKLQRTASGDSFSVITTWSGSTGDQYSQAVMSTVASNAGPTLRSDGTSTMYLLACNVGGSTTRVYKCVSGTFTQLDSVASVPSNGDTIYFEIQGYAMISKFNTTVVNNFTDGGSAIATGKPGMYFSGTSPIFDDWAAGDFSTSLARQSYTVMQAVHRSAAW